MPKKKEIKVEEAKKEEPRYIEFLAGYRYDEQGNKIEMWEKRRNKNWKRK